VVQEDTLDIAAYIPKLMMNISRSLVMNPYRAQGTREEYLPELEVGQPTPHHYDRYSWRNLRHMITQGPNGKVAINFGTVSYFYPSIFALELDLEKLRRTL